MTWLYTLDQGYRDSGEMEVLSGMTEGLRNFAMQYNYAINDPDLIRRYRMIEDGKHDLATKMSVAIAKAEAGARARGENLARLEIARGMRAKGFSPREILELTGVSEEELSAP